ncbi:hypothetical protein AAHA92_21726 [Salvia divinorum]|uniref:Uncharacterized protein n=1 Tax=Salvia divinorum TaxID=28513 RepID=A0ABD1GML3_SALDI
MENSGDKGAAEGVGYWLQWQVLLSALICVLPTVVAVRFLRRIGGGSDPLKSVDLWSPCWRNLHPRWLLFYRAFAFITMAYLLYETVAALGFIVFLFYTQWTFVLVVVYFGIATLVSIRGCRKPGEKESNLGVDEKLGFLEHLMQIIYQTSAGAIMLTDIVFWCLLLPFMLGENFQLTLLIGCMHSVNAVFLILESALNRMVAISFS